MDNKITVTLTTYNTVWRYQGDIENGNILNSKLELLMQREYRDDSGQVYKVEALPTIAGTPEELGFLEEFTSIQAKLYALTN